MIIQTKKVDSHNKIKKSRHVNMSSLSVKARFLCLSSSLTDISSSSVHHDKNTNFIIKNNRTLRVRVRVRFFLFYSELGPTDPSCNML